MIHQVLALVFAAILTAAPDPNHEILSAPFQADTEARSHSILTSGNQLELLENGVVAFPRKHALIAGATANLFVMTMQWNHDGTGIAFADALVAAQARGVAVRCVVDGTLADARIVRQLRAGGVKVARYNPWYFGFGGRSGRMHEKIVCADFARATSGGMNIADGYALGNGTNDKYHDVDIYVEGHAAVEIGRRFLELYTQIDTGDAAARALFQSTATLRQMPPAPAPGQDGYARVIANEPDIGRHDVTDYYARAIRAAKTQIVWHVNNPQPREPILTELKGAGLRGVRVVIVTNSKVAYQAKSGWFAGFWQNWWIQLFDRPRLDSPGIEIWEMDSPIHSKALTIDGVMASIGSYNLGESSIERNTEQVVVTYDPATIADVEAMFDRDLARARRVQ